jgi:hypothetical protein
MNECAAGDGAVCKFEPGFEYNGIPRVLELLPGGCKDLPPWGIGLNHDHKNRY